MTEEKIYLRERWRDINYLGPAYGEQGGNSTLFIMSGGSRLLDPRRTRTILSALARVFSRDLVSLREEGGRFLRRKQEVPLVLSPDMILVPIRTRCARCRDDGTTGYLVLDKVSELNEVKEAPYRSKIIFKGGGEIKSLYNLKTVRNRLNESRELKHEKEKLFWNEAGFNAPVLLREQAGDLVWLLAFQKKN